MKKYIYLICMVAVAINMLTSCEDILNKSPLDLRTEETVWSDPKLAQAYLNRIWYMTGRNDYGNETWFSLYAGPLTPGTDITSDNCYSNWNRGAAASKDDSNWNENTDIGLFDNYIDIRRCNIAIDHLTAGCGFGEEIERDMLGQAYFAKGLNYITRAKAFGGYPIIDKTLTPDDELDLPRASAKETFDYGIGLLEKAADLLNKTSPSGRPNKGAAYALLSEANINAAAFIKYAMINNIQPTIDLKPYYDAAIKAVENLDALGIYKLETAADWKKQFNDFAYVAGNPSETILAQFTPPGLYQLRNDKMVEINCYLPTFYDDLLTDEVKVSYNNKPYLGYTLIDGWQTIAPNPKTVEESFYIKDLDGKARRWQESQLFEKYVTVTDGVYALNAAAAADGVTDISELMYANRDNRFYGTVAYDGSTYFGNQFDVRRGGNMHPLSFKTLNGYGAITGYLFIKPVPQTKAWTQQDYSGFHRNCLRLSKAYLNAAEAYMLKEDWTNARTYINKTRTNNGQLPALLSENGDELWKIYVDERNAELMLENDRYYTLLRYGIHKKNAEIIDQMNFGLMKQLEIAADGKSYEYVDLLLNSSTNNFVFNRYRYLFPIAKKYIDANPNYAPQNPRY